MMSVQAITLFTRIESRLSKAARHIKFPMNPIHIEIVMNIFTRYLFSLNFFRHGFYDGIF